MNCVSNVILSVVILPRLNIMYELYCHAVKQLKLFQLENEHLGTRFIGNVKTNLGGI
jgi:hypothetical protein